jgi:hypothetical protein
MDAKEYFMKMRPESQRKVIELFRDMEEHPTVEGAVWTHQTKWLQSFGPGYKNRHMLKLMDEYEDRKKPLAWFPKVTVEWMESNLKEVTPPLPEHSVVVEVSQ